MGQKYTNIGDLYKQVKLNEQEIIERKLTSQELEDREKIAKKLPMDDFKKRYGKDAMAVKMATATNIVKKKSQNETMEDELGEKNLTKAKKLMGPSKNKEQGIEFVMKGLKISKDDATKMVNKILGVKESLDEKYDLYHSTFSGAMQHAYDYAKKKMGITVDPKEIDSKVATGPRKPTEGKTNKYRLKGKGGNLQIQVFNKGGSKPFELNMYKEEVEINEDGHQDVASAIRQCKTITEDAMQIMSKLQSMSPEDSLPTWWTNKLAVASNSMNKIRDYLLVPSVSESVELDEKAGDTNDMKKLVGELQNASKMHLAQSKRVRAHLNMMKAGNLRGTVELAPIINELEKASEAHKRQSKTIAKHMEVMGEETLNEQPEHEITVGNYTTKHFFMCGSAQTVMKKHADKDGAEELTKMQDVFYKMEHDAMLAGGASDEQKKKSQILYDKIIAKAKEVGIADEVDKYMKMHLDSMLKNDPKLGFGRTDKKESYQEMISRIMSRRSMR